MSNPLQKVFNFTYPHPAETGRIPAEIRKIMNRMIKQSGLSREQIADYMNGLLGRRLVSAAQINTWTRDASPRHIPLQFMFAFELACGGTGLTEFMCTVHGGRFVCGDELDALTLGQIQAQKSELVEKERQIKKRLAR